MCIGRLKERIWSSDLIAFLDMSSNFTSMQNIIKKICWIMGDQEKTSCNVKLTLHEYFVVYSTNYIYDNKLPHIIKVQWVVKLFLILQLCDKVKI